MFWESVDDYHSAEDRSADRLLRMNQAWSIYNIYLAVNSPNYIGVLILCVVLKIENLTHLLGILYLHVHCILYKLMHMYVNLYKLCYAF